MATWPPLQCVEGVVQDAELPAQSRQRVRETRLEECGCRSWNHGMFHDCGLCPGRA